MKWGRKQKKQKKALEPRTIWGVGLIPFCFVVCALIMDVVMFAYMGVSFPRFYFVSVLLLIAIAGVVSCIPKRGVQVGILGLFLVLQVITSVGNVIAYRNLQEIFSIETLFAWREVLTSEGAQKYDPLGAGLTFGAMAVVFIAGAIVLAYLFRKQKAGYTFRMWFAVGAAVMVMFSAMFVHIKLLKKDNADYFELMIDANFSISTYTNRTMVLNTFGSPVYYAGNLLNLGGAMSMANSKFAKKDFGWDNVDDYYDDYDYKLGKDHNLIMLMMETVEYDGINLDVTPHLWGLKQKSTWVDGYYSTERTCFTEYAALTGSHVKGVEMWRDYRNIRVPQSLPNIFRHAGYDQIGAFHGFQKEFYSRDRLFTKDRLGFDFMYDPKSFPGGTINPDIMQNSDAAMFDLMKEKIAPTDGTRFFSYVLNTSTHAPHFDAANTYPSSKSTALQANTGSNSNNAINDKYETVLNVQSLIHVMDNYDSLAVRYPKLNSNSLAVRWATVAFLVAIRDFDIGIGTLLRHLEGVDEHGNRIRDNNLMENTALILFSDHYDYMAYGHAATSGGGLLSKTSDEWPIGEKCVFMIYNPEDDEALGGGREIPTFMTNTDIYKTIAHLFDIQTHNNFTLGNSILARINGPRTDVNDISVGIRFYNSQFFGIEIGSIDQTNSFSTYDFVKFEGKKPSSATMILIRERLTSYAGTMFVLRSYYDGNRFRKDSRCRYEMGVRRGPAQP